MVPEFLALMHVGDVDLDHRRIERVEGVKNCDRSMGERRGVDDDRPAVSRASWIQSMISYSRLL